MSGNNNIGALERFLGSEDYVVTDELKNAVNIAIALEKPLLIKGEPGTGKTVLAKAIANTLNKRLIIWNIKSTTKAQEGLYVYDTVQRLYDSQFGEGDVSDIKRYIKLGQLGQALGADDQVVLLIDEIDKADLEFPNDLLWELDQMEFFIPETRERISAKTRPIVVITSNAEKELPNAFLRRCIFHYIAFPEADQMAEIVHVHYPNIEDELLSHAMDKFYEIRSVKDMQKKPSTSELLDWLMALMLTGIPLEKIDAETPYLGVLLKKNEDIDALELAKEKNASRSNLRR
ncbi:MAG: MoxR family ATPase [Peptococcaceae bacterium]|nr:MoxR family ATPase [Peptococcaceae bacterium]